MFAYLRATARGALGCAAILISTILLVGLIRVALIALGFTAGVVWETVNTSRPAGVPTSAPISYPTAAPLPAVDQGATLEALVTQHAPTPDTFATISAHTLTPTPTGERRPTSAYPVPPQLQTRWATAQP